ncbi:hypothetical protein LTR53_018480, partial [Teratosphaeriaceae sp. CCFEE 6253]
MRKFFEGLETMSRYWECSDDHYYDAEAVRSGKGAKRMRLEKYVDIQPPSNGSELDAVAGAFSGLNENRLTMPIPVPSSGPPSSLPIHNNISQVSNSKQLQPINGNDTVISSDYNPSSHTPDPEPMTRQR